MTEDDDGDQDISTARFDSEPDEVYVDRDAAPIVQAMQCIYDKARDISSEIISQSLSQLPLPLSTVQTLCDQHLVSSDDRKYNDDFGKRLLHSFLYRIVS